MTKVYLRAEDNEAGVTVDNSTMVKHVVVRTKTTNPVVWSDREAAAVLLGLSLRAESKGDWSHVETGLIRMLEADGEDAFFEFLLKIVPDMLAGDWR